MTHWRLREAIPAKHQQNEVLGLKGAKRGLRFPNGRSLLTAACYRSFHDGVIQSFSFARGKIAKVFATAGALV
jgi:hypothetical protein